MKLWGGKRWEGGRARKKRSLSWWCLLDVTNWERRLWKIHSSSHCWWKIDKLFFYRDFRDSSSCMFSHPVSKKCLEQFSQKGPTPAARTSNSNQLIAISIIRVLAGELFSSLRVDPSVWVSKAMTSSSFFPSLPRQDAGEDVSDITDILDERSVAPQSRHRGRSLSLTFYWLRNR